MLNFDGVNSEDLLSRTMRSSLHLQQPHADELNADKRPVNRDETIKKKKVRLLGLCRLIYEEVIVRLFTMYHVDDV